VLDRIGLQLVLSLLVVSIGCGKPQDLSTQQLSQVVDAERPSLKRCYDAALKEQPYRQEIRMEAVIHIAPAGHVTGVELEGGLRGMAACLRKAIGAWRFPRARDATHTSLPLVFTPEITPPAPPNLEVLEDVLKGVRPE
jgi:hypothetical protein